MLRLLLLRLLVFLLLLLLLLRMLLLLLSLLLSLLLGLLLSLLLSLLLPHLRLLLPAAFLMVPLHLRPGCCVGVNPVRISRHHWREPWRPLLRGRFVGSRRPSSAVGTACGLRRSSLLGWWRTCCCLRVRRRCT